MPQYKIYKRELERPTSLIDVVEARDVISLSRAIQNGLLDQGYDSVTADGGEDSRVIHARSSIGLRIREYELRKVSTVEHGSYRPYHD